MRALDGYLQSSPHTRGCFRLLKGQEARAPVFPAYAGVFPAVYAEPEKVRGLPRIRGGVSGYYMPGVLGQ